MILEPKTTDNTIAHDRLPPRQRRALKELLHRQGKLISREFLIVAVQTLINIIVVALRAAQRATRPLVWFAKPKRTAGIVPGILSSNERCKAKMCENIRRQLDA
jgi:hypothetical protein